MEAHRGHTQHPQALAARNTQTRLRLNRTPDIDPTEPDLPRVGATASLALLCHRRRTHRTLAATRPCDTRVMGACFCSDRRPEGAGDRQIWRSQRRGQDPRPPTPRSIVRLNHLRRGVDDACNGRDDSREGQKRGPPAADKGGGGRSTSAASTCALSAVRSSTSRSASHRRSPSMRRPVCQTSGC